MRKQSSYCQFSSKNAKAHLWNFKRFCVRIKDMGQIIFTKYRILFSFYCRLPVGVSRLWTAYVLSGNAAVTDMLCSLAGEGCTLFTIFSFSFTLFFNFTYLFIAFLHCPCHVSITMSSFVLCILFGLSEFCCYWDKCN